MAQKAKKDRAKANISTLNTLHITALTLNAAFILFSIFIRRRSFLTYTILSLPSLIAEFILETTGRPKYDATTKALKSAGEDLAAEGLTEYMFDVIWVTWASLVAVVVCGNWGWLVWGVVPVFGVWKGWGLLGMARGMMGGGQGGQGQAPEGQMAAGQGNRKQRRAA
ncbi:SRP-independent targeting protein 2-like [Lachnellula arida]|uniref:SRP-independent targeting protein 2-like n=1 Tax=Lachnellula arida TaxID=1316785 RepID=A0A8T9BM76_9HELO|nr:SRP-independent targeting protein 2-like [Lachnellula arida]